MQIRRSQEYDLKYRLFFHSILLLALVCRNIHEILHIDTKHKRKLAFLKAANSFSEFMFTHYVYECSLIPVYGLFYFFRCFGLSEKNFGVIRIH